MRAFAKDKESYDGHLKNAILVGAKDTVGQESHDIWKCFQPKFSLVSDLCKYYRFFKILVKSVLEDCIMCSLWSSATAPVVFSMNSGSPCL